MTDSFYVNWTTQLRKGLLELAILNTLDGGSLFGYDIVRRLGEVDGLVITEGTVYPILRRLEDAGLVRSRWEHVQRARDEGRPPRRYYELTGSGAEVAREALARYPDTRAVLAGAPVPRPA